MPQNHSHHIIATYALLILASPLIWAGNASAQSVSCPTGYTCTVYRSTQVSSCPLGYVCTPNSSTGTNAGTSVNTGSTLGNGYYYSNGYTNNSNSGYGNTTQNYGSNNSVNSACYTFSTNLSVGSTGNDVVALQNFLISKGYSLPNLTSGRVAKGSFGTNTAAALRRYQIANGITSENGQLGPLTRAKLNAMCSAVTTTSTGPNQTNIITLRGPTIDTFTVSPSTVTEGQNVTFSGTARQGSFCLEYYKAIVVDSQTPSWATTTNRWSTLGCKQSVTLSNVVNTAKNPYAFNGPGTYKVRWQVQDKDGRVVSQERTVVVTAVTSGTITNTPSPTSGTDNKPIGYLDNVSCSLIQGWTYDPDAPATSIGVHFYAGGEVGHGGTFIGSTVANIARPDVNSNVGITGNHGFSLVVPASLFDGASHAIYVYGINSNTSVSTNNSALTNNGLVITGCK